MKAEKLEDIKSTRFLIDGVEYLRINGVWFKYTEKQYNLIDGYKFEQYYKEHFNND